ncbi:hypothetical protein [Spongiivirga citrea]|uniref:Uncharacterized protein n=1 Tax=Spongiivirga citrea TaxID=1481457 RepID=A0A6M0CJH8_9FLAO|nr:hypothetical protein [Spongiivirga citrea]NER16089.1 hypothetical protein [Spongiivirga citrea]
MKTTMHLAAQYLATAAISFIVKKEDDSHTNLGWNDHILETHEFSNGDKLGLNYQNFSLEWMQQNGSKESFSLNQSTHKEITDWISQTSISKDIQKPYKYELHYELPYNEVTDESNYELTNREDLNTLIKQRDLAQDVISSILKFNEFDSAIRIWPHHFDTGAFVIVNDNLSIGIGMAIPDSFINDFYFYISGYDGHDPVILKSVDDLKHGNYYTNEWQGFAISLNGLDNETAIDFSQTAINSYLNTIA